MAKPRRQEQKKKIIQPEKAAQSYSWLWPLLLIIITWVLYSGSLNNQLTTWDDKNYINENTFIRSTKTDSLKALFHPNVQDGGFIMGNYHPLTIISYAYDYKKGGLDPRSYHVTNLIFHIFNTLLVYLFILLLARHRIVAFITALLFAIHPMHVESVAWVAERKDVMFTFFYLAALCVYVLYVRAERGAIKWLIIALLLYVLSLLSKGMAVTLPVVMLLVDYFLERKFTMRVLLEKVPFFVLSFVFGLIAVEAQKSAGAIGTFITYSFADRILLSFYGLWLYLSKALAPVNLSCFYSYPLKVHDKLPAIMYLFPLVIGGLAFLVYYSLRFGRTVAFGAAFFLVTIALVLQVLPVGGAIIAERYTYIPYIGLFFMLAVGAVKLIDRRPATDIRPVIIGGLAVLSVIFFYVSRQRTKVWKDSITLWSDAISKDTIAPAAFNGRGDAYNMLKQYDLAIPDFKKALALQEAYPEAHYNLGLAYYYKGMHQDAINEYTRAIQVKPDLAVAYFNRSGTYYTIQQYKLALDDALKASELGYKVDPKYIEVLQQALVTAPANQ
jgi:hypothetical protein